MNSPVTDKKPDKKSGTSAVAEKKPEKIVLSEKEAAKLYYRRLTLLIGGLLLLILCWYLWRVILMPFVAAFLISYMLHPVVTKMQRWGIPRSLGAIFCLSGIFCVIILFFWLISPLFTAEFRLLLNHESVAMTQIKQFISNWTAAFHQHFDTKLISQQFFDTLNNRAGEIATFGAQALTRLIDRGRTLIGFVIFIIVTPIISFYQIKNWPKMLVTLDSLLPRAGAEIWREQLREINAVLASWLRGQFLAALILGVFYAIALSAVGLDYGAVVGFMAGILSFIPFVGTIVGGATAFILALGQYTQWSGVIIVMTVFVVGNLLENYVIYPKLLGDRVKISEVWIIFALLAGGEAFGFLGVLLAVPAAAVIGVLWRYGIKRYRASALYDISLAVKEEEADKAAETGGEPRG